jgi:putative radical SAM enzyme (TIGR03279 family)
MTGLLITEVLPESIAEEMQMEPGDRLLAINGHRVRDIIDYNFHAADEDVTVDLEKPDGEVWEIEIEKDEGESLGLIFAPPEPARCGNRCVFCFVHQLPKGLRAPLYVKDEDYRLSFLYGNYVTLANIDDGDLVRIKEQRLSPLYVSVHATEPALREQLLGKRGIRPILDVMQELAEARILMHTQVVLCPGLNDGHHLEQTIDDLAALRPWVASVAVVPVGITTHRRRLRRLEPVTELYAADFIAEWGARSRQLAEGFHAPFLYLADEFYIKAGLPFPPLEEYGDLPQLENGVGMIPLFLAEAEDVLAEAEPLTERSVTLVTGVSPFSFLAGFLERLSAATGVTLQLQPVENLLFGDMVTVTGLVCGSDIVASLRDKALGELVLVPDVMLKEGEGMFLDDMTVGELEAKLGRKVTVVRSTPRGIYEALMPVAV